MTARGRWRAWQIREWSSLQALQGRLAWRQAVPRPEVLAQGAWAPRAKRELPELAEPGCLLRPSSPGRVRVLAELVAAWVW